jgi:hypothetical protein
VVADPGRHAAHVAHTRPWRRRRRHAHESRPGCGEGSRREAGQPRLLAGNLWMRLMADRTPLAFPFALANSAANLVKEAVAAQVVSLFSEGSRAYPTKSRNAAAMRSEERLFPPTLRRTSHVRRRSGSVLRRMARIGDALGADPVPRSTSEAQHLIEAMRPQLVVSARTRQVAPARVDSACAEQDGGACASARMQAAIDLLPAWARRMHGLRNPPLGVPLVRAGTLGVARTLRWALD